MASDRNIATELERWTSLAATHGHDSWEGKPESANRAFAELQKTEKDLEEMDPTAVAYTLEPLLRHNDLYVRAAAARWMLRLDPQLAVPVLEELDKTFGGGWQIDAHYTLEAFREGA